MRCRTAKADKHLMAKNEYLDQLLKGAAHWNEWVKAHHRLNEKDLVGVDFGKAYLRKANLSLVNLSGANLRDANLNDANLSGADLRRADLSEANLRGANLRSAHLIDANLSWSHLSGADLSMASLYKANFGEANLSGANLYGANLSGANLYGANLCQVDLKGANLAEARLGSTVFGAVDLSMVSKLETVQHRGPSTIGIDTLYQSGGKIPEAFLRGAGVPDNLIAYVGSLVGQPIDFYSCFISYSHADKSFARRLHDTLQGRGIRCWMDEHQILPGDDLYDQVDRGIRLWDKVLLCCSAASLSSWWVDSEINKAFTKEQALMKDRRKKTLALIPLNLDGELFRWQDGKADEVRRRAAADFTNWESDNAKFEAQLELVVKALRIDDGVREVAPPPRL